MIIIVSKTFIRCLTFNFVKGISLYPFVILDNKELKLDKAFINHEKIHLKQQVELLLVFFYIWYLIEFVVKLLKYRNFYEAYRNISFEREAYTNDADLTFLNNRKFWGFIQYL